MLLGEIVGRVWAEKQLPGLGGRPLVAVRERNGGAILVALDLIEAGVGARVLILTGAPARLAADGAPVDAVVTAIVRTDAAVGEPGRPPAPPAKSS